jgi:hypothetical protein
MVQLETVLKEKEVSEQQKGDFHYLQSQSQVAK